MSPYSPRVLRLALVLLVLAGVPVAADGPNLVTNGGFDTSIAGWTSTGPANLVWSTADANGSPHSGSARVAMQQSGVAIVAGSPCLTLKAGGSYVLRAWTWIEGAGPADLVTASVGFYSDPACTSSLHGAGTPGDSTIRGWQEVSGLVTNLTTDVFARPWFVIDDKPPRGVVAYFDDVSLRTGTCAPGPEVLCLNDGRFAVTASWRTADGTLGFARAVPFSSDSGSFWFFSPTNLELDVKVLDGCGVNGHRWVFAAGLTNVEVTIFVQDTVTGELRTYVNPLGQRFRAVMDTDAFATCP